MHHVQDESKVERKLEEFKTAYETRAASFYTYFQKEWVAACKYKLWIATYRGDDCPTTTSALEAYHGVIKLLFTSTRCAAQGFTIRVLQSGFYKRNVFRPTRRRRRRANRRLDWLVYTIMERIVPYFFRKYARNTRDQDECDLMAYVHTRIGGDDKDEDASVDGTDTAAGPVSQAQARAVPDQAWRGQPRGGDRGLARKCGRMD
jgi:hypothetical protein